ncbi:MAG: hypothetical protein DRR06_16590 [Gammaproteobacteria bacterium]|nr:MAG: hypothetical protein DRR06_16590 [Gammaproteobacteria bacterium]
MSELSFTEEDRQTVIDFLNAVATHAELKLNTGDLIKYFNLLARMQKTILPKLNANILELKKIVEAAKESGEE